MKIPRIAQFGFSVGYVAGKVFLFLLNLLIWAVDNIFLLLAVAFLCNEQVGMSLFFLLVATYVAQRESRDEIRRMNKFFTSRNR